MLPARDIVTVTNGSVRAVLEPMRFFGWLLAVLAVSALMLIAYDLNKQTGRMSSEDRPVQSGVIQEPAAQNPIESDSAARGRSTYPVVPVSRLIVNYIDAKRKIIDDWSRVSLEVIATFPQRRRAADMSAYFLEVAKTYEDELSAIQAMSPVPDVCRKAQECWLAAVKCNIDLYRSESAKWKAKEEHVPESSKMVRELQTLITRNGALSKQLEAKAGTEDNNLLSIAEADSKSAQARISA